MARVVQRSAPPYLLIIFVFLFLVATTLAVLMYLDADKTKKSLAEKTQTLDKLATPEELERDELRSRMNVAGTARERNSVIGQLTQQIGQLNQLITGKLPSGLTVAAAEAEANKAYERVGARPGLASAVLSAYDQIDLLKNDLVEWQRKYRSSQEEVKAKQKAVEGVTASFNADRKRLEGEIASLTRRFETFRAEHATAMTQAKEQWAKEQADLNRRISELAQEIREAESDKMRLQGQLTRASNELKTLRGGKEMDVDRLLRQPDGKVSRVLEHDNVCYINIGRKDNVAPGITFAVYPPSGIPETGKGKGSIRVNKVTENVSECIIIRQDRKNPIAPGDLIANLAFDAIRDYTFVVEGTFDLYGTDRHTQEGNEEVKAIIRRFGAKVADQVGVDTDFVIMGKEPPRPPRPPETAQPQTWRVYNDQMKAFNRYNDVRELAGQMQIPILNTNRFLAYMGYTPTGAVHAD